MSQHLINKVSLDFTFPGGKKEEVLIRTRQLFLQTLLPCMEAGAGFINEYVRIDKLEIEIGDVTEAALSEKFAAQFQAVLTEKIKEARLRNSKQSHIVSPGIRPAHSPVVSSGSRKVMTAPDILFYLSRGYWPWQFQTLSLQELAAYLRSFSANPENYRELLALIRAEKQNTPHRWMQLIFMHTFLLKGFLQALTFLHPPLKAYPFFITPGKAAHKIKPDSFTADLLLQLLIAPAMETETAWRLFVNQLVREATKTDRVYKKTALSPQGIIKKIKRQLNDTLLLQLCEELDEGRRTDQQNEVLAAFADVTAGKQLLHENEEQAQQGIHVHNAGLILFHPYLPMLFRELNWLDEKKQFRSPAVQQRAILLLQFLLNGKSKQAEHVLAVNKLLCGWPLEKPLNLQQRFSANEKEAVREMGLSLIEHWTVLKSTSLRGLLESFINRKGVIQKTADGWQLQVETRSIDILLESLPFGIQTIKLPWNEFIIHTTWTN